jgi:DNA polymerase elongation subunit (family B)
MVVGDQKIEHEKGDYEGAYVKEPIPGMYNAVAAYDFASLYPSVMRQFNISPESFVKKSNKEEVLEPYRKNKDYIVAVNGAVYKADKESALTTILSDLYGKRRFYKDKYLEIEKQLSKLKNKN